MTDLPSRTTAVPPVTVTRVLVRRDVLETIAQCVANCGGEPEVGGLLLGYRRETDIDIVYATTPGILDIATSASFVRRDPIHQMTAAYHWLISGSKIDWAGEWHSHLEVSPGPSARDLKTWREQIARRKKKMAYGIVGYNATWIGVLEPGSATPATMSVIERNFEGELYSMTRAEPSEFLR